MVAKETVPRAGRRVEFENVKETILLQFVHEVILILGGWKGRHNQVQKRTVVAFQYIPTIFQTADR